MRTRGQGKGQNQCLTILGDSKKPGSGNPNSIQMNIVRSAPRLWDSALDELAKSLEQQY
jgi:hypothetical protein